MQLFIKIFNIHPNPILILYTRRIIKKDAPVAHSLKAVTIERFLKSVELYECSHTRFLIVHKIEKLIHNDAVRGKLAKPELINP